MYALYVPDHELEDFLKFACPVILPQVVASRCVISPFDEGGSIEDFLQSLDLGILPELEERPAQAVPLSEEAFKPFSFVEKSVIQEMALRLMGRLLASGPFAFLDLRPFDGDGIYALYYHGDIPAYRPVRSPGSTCPIYIGKAVQRGTRRSLFTRLREHAVTIEQAHLGLGNFTFRFVCLPTSLVEFAESNLIALFRPLWNGCLRGFGERTGNRRSRQRTVQLVSPWDTFHPGREVSGTLRDLENLEHRLYEAGRECRRAFESVMALMQCHRASSGQAAVP